MVWYVVATLSWMLRSWGCIIWIALILVSAIHSTSSGFFCLSWGSSYLEYSKYKSWIKKRSSSVGGRFVKADAAASFFLALWSGDV